ncbi:MAG: hypothetical protein ACPGWR_28480 [Ardenticatenaceae bacterium]
MRRYAMGAFLGAVLVTPVVGLMSLAHEVIGHAHLPVELIHSSFGLAITNAVLFAEQGFVMVPYFLWGVMLSVLAYARWSRVQAFAGLMRGVKIGLLFGLPLILIVALLAPTWAQSVLGVLLLSLLFVCWGAAYRYVYNQVASAMNPPTGQERVLKRAINRRQLLLGAGAAATLVAIVSGGMGRLLHRSRRELLGQKFNIHPSLPTTLMAQVYLTNPSFQFPEQNYARYQPSGQPFGVCFSSGGSRAASAAVGQMRALHALGLLDSIGAISGVSGGGWFGTIFTYASTDFDDATLLGPILEPEEITIENLSQINPHMITAPITTMTDSNLLSVTRDIMRGIILSDTAAFNRFFSRMLNDTLLKPFQLDDHHKFFTLDDEAVRDIISRNPSLKPEHFYTARPNRPYLICGSTHVYPPGPDQVLRPFEFTPLYSGMAEFFQDAGHEGVHLGGGYIESFAFDSLAPVNLHSRGFVTVPTPEPIFLLSDMIGSTSSAVGVMLAHYQEPELMPEFKLWPLAEGDKQTAHNYSIVDGAGIEHHGIIPLLRRQYPVILAFVNTLTPLGTNSNDTVQGIASQVSRLFGFPPPQVIYNKQNTQVFPSEQFEPLATALKAARQKGDLAVYVDSYEIVQPNFFDIPSYPGDGKVTVVWFYNDLNENWRNKLSPDVQALLNSSDPTNRMDNFPHFRTIGQNQTDDGIPELLHYSPQQVNLLAHMWCYNIMHEAKDLLLSLK